jgi:hypothetical protein
MTAKSKLLSKKIYGDITLVSQMLGTTPDNTRRLLSRTNAKRHNEAVKALEKVIALRGELLDNN